MMRLIVLSLFIILNVVLPPSHASAEATDTLQDKDRFLKMLKYAELKDAKLTTLSNGIRFIHYERGISPVFAGVVMVNVGGVDEEVGSTGIAHLLEHMAFKGTSKIGTEDYTEESTLLRREDELRVKKELSDGERNELKEISARLAELGDGEALTKIFIKSGGINLNASTSKDQTTYYIEMPSSSFEKWAELESARLKDPVFREFYQEQKVVLEERYMRSENDPFGKLYENLLLNSFSKHPYRHPVIGYEDDIISLTRPMLYDFKKKYYQPDNLAIAVVGKIDYDEAYRVIEKYFGDIKPEPFSSKELPTEPVKAKETVIKVNKKVVAPYVLVAYPKPAYPDPSDPHITIAEEVLAGSVLSPLYQDLVESKKVASDISVFEAPGNRYDNLVVFGLAASGGINYETLIKEFDQSLKLALNNFDKRLVSTAKRSFLVGNIGTLKNNLELAKQMTSSLLTYNDHRKFHDWLEGVILASDDDIIATARRIFSNEKRTVVYME